MERTLQFALRMKAGELCIRIVFTADPDESVIEAARRMRDQRVGDLVVVDQVDGAAHPIGIITDRDLVTRALAEGGAGLRLRVRDVIADELVTATEDDHVEAVLAKLDRHGIRRIPIVDHAGRLQGILTLDDIVTWIGEQVEHTRALIGRQAELGPPA